MKGMKGMEEIGPWVEYRRGLGLSESVVRSQARQLTLFFEEVEGRVASVYAVGPALFKEWVDGLFEKKSMRSGQRIAPATIDGHVGAVRAFYRYLLDRGVVLADPTASYRTQERRDALPRRVLERREVAKLLAAPDLARPIEYRDRTILEVLYSTGMRRSEVSRLEIDDVDFVRGLARVETAKNKMGRLVAIGRVALTYLAGYLDEVRPVLEKKATKGERSRALFLSSSGGRLSAEQLGNRVKLYVRRSGIREEHSTHSLRHTCATHMLDGGAGVRVVAEQLGHRSLESTVIYTRVTPRGLEKAVRRFHPRERRKAEEVQAAPEVPRSWWANRRGGEGGDAAE